MPVERESDEAIFRAFIRDLRQSRGVTQADLAIALSKPQSFVSKYETGERFLGVIEVRSICLALGVSFADFAVALEARLIEDNQ